MDEIAIKRHSFDLAKERLKEFSEKTNPELKIDKVETDGGFLFLGDHKVTGYELNERLETIQDHFIDFNATNNKVIKEFREIYNALDVLDKDYIASIVANVKAIEKTSNDVRAQQGMLKQHNEKLADQQSKLNVHQSEIEKNVENISKIVTILKAFKEKLDSYTHLTDVDRIWRDCKKIQDRLAIVSDSITKLSKKTTKDITKANNQNKTIQDRVDVVSNSITMLSQKVTEDIAKTNNQNKTIQDRLDIVSDSITLLSKRTIEDIAKVDSKNKTLSDQVNKDILTLRDEGKSFENSLENIKADILKMQKHLDEIDFLVALVNESAHLQDIDNMWADLDICKVDIERISQNTQEYQNRVHRVEQEGKIHTDKLDEYASKITECERKNEELAVAIQKSNKEVNESIAETAQTFREAIDSLRKKVKYAYWIAGGSAGFAIIELILLLIKVI